jgi:hypothetical protein
MILDIEAFAGTRLGPGTPTAPSPGSRAGLIRPLSSSDRRQPYKITADGRAYLREQLAGLEQIVRTGLKRLKHA